MESLPFFRGLGWDKQKYSPEVSGKHPDATNVWRSPVNWVMRRGPYGRYSIWLKILCARRTQ